MPFAARGGPAGPGGFSGYGYPQAPYGIPGPSGSVGCPGSSGSSGSLRQRRVRPLGRRHLHRRRLDHPLQRHRRLQQTGVYKDGGTLNALQLAVRRQRLHPGQQRNFGPFGADYSGSAGGTAPSLQQPPGEPPERRPSMAAAPSSATPASPAGWPSTAGPTETIALLSSSQAIGIGQNPPNGVILFTDQRGYVPTTSSWDAGAYQSDAAPGPGAHGHGLGAATCRSAAMARPATSSPSPTTAPPASCPAPSPAPSSRSRRPAGVGGPIAATVVSSTASWPTPPATSRRSPSPTRSRRRAARGPRPTTASTRSTSPARRSPTRRATRPRPGRSAPSSSRWPRSASSSTAWSTNRATGFWSGKIVLTNTGQFRLHRPDLRPLLAARRGDPGERHRHLQRPCPTWRSPPGRSPRRGNVVATVTFNVDVSPTSYSTSYYLGSLGS